MNPTAKFLTLALAVQLLLVVAIFWPRPEPAEGLASSPLVDLEPENVSRIVISDRENTMLLNLSGSKWTMPEYHHLPVAAGKIDTLLQQLPGLSRGWPVAQTNAALERFEVSDGNFQRRVDYFVEEDNAGSIFIGTSPGFRKVHARPGNASEVYAVEFNNFELPTDASAWMDKTLLQVEQVEAVTGLDYAISQNGDSWTDAEGTNASQDTVDGLVNGLQSLRISGVADIATAAILAETAVPPTLEVRSGDRDLEYRLYEIEDAYYVRRADIPMYFSLSALDYDRLTDVDAATLFPVAAAEASPGTPEADAESEAESDAESEAETEAGPGETVSVSPAIDD